MVRPGEGPVALLALEGAVPGVFAIVPGQFIRAGKFPPTAVPVTVVGFLTWQRKRNPVKPSIPNTEMTELEPECQTQLPRKHPTLKAARGVFRPIQGHIQFQIINWNIKPKHSLGFLCVFVFFKEQTYTSVLLTFSFS